MYFFFRHTNIQNMKRFLLSLLGVVVFSTLQASNGAANPLSKSDRDALQLTFTKLDPSCFGYTNGTATVTPTGGQSPYTINWDNGQHGFTNLGLNAGTYSVTVIDASGESASGNVSLNQPNALLAGIPAVAAGCGAYSGPLTSSVTGGTAPYTYSWNGGASSSTININNGGNYFVTITDAKACSVVATRFINLPLSVELVDSDIPCFMFCDGGVTAVVTNGVLPYSFLWSTGSTNPSIENLPPGDYSVTVTDGNNCSVVKTTNISEPPAIEIAMISGGGANCNGGVNGMTVQATGGTPPFAYLWSNGTVGPTLTNVPAGTYFVQVTDANSCQKSMPFTLDAQGGLNVSLNIGSAACSGVANGTASVSVNPPGGNYTYQWNVQNNPPVTQLNGLAAGTNVQITVTDAVSGCTGTASAIVSAHTQVQVLVTDTDVNCANSPTGTASASAFNGTAPYSFAWIVNGNTVNSNQVSGLVAGAYQVIATDATGCTSVGVADINANSALLVDYNLNVVECVGNQVVLSFSDNSTDPGNTINSWNWNIAYGSGTTQSTSSTTNNITVDANQTGTIQLTVGSAGGCTASLSEQFTVDALPNVNVDLNLPAVSCAGAAVPISVTGSSSYTYVWSPSAGLTINNPQSIIANPAVSTVYTLTVNNGACQKIINVPVQLSPAINLNAPDDMVTCNTEEMLVASASTPVDFAWFDGNTMIADTSLVLVPCGQIKNYTVVATDALGCSVSDNVSITGIGVDVSVDNAALQGCENTLFPINITSNDPTDVITYNWTTTSTNVTILPANTPNPMVIGDAGSGVLTLVATNQNSCTTTLEVAFNFTDGDALNDAITPNLCDGLQVTFANLNDVPGIWSFGDGSTANTPDANHMYATSGSYVVSFNPNAACIASYDTLITVNPTPAIAAAFGQDIQGCEDEAVFQFNDSTLHSGNNLQYSWTFTGINSNFPFSLTSNEINPLMTFTQAGPVTVVLNVVDENQCASSKTFVLPYHIITDEIPAVLSYCTGTEVALNPVSDPSYAHSWTSTPPDADLITNSSNPIVSPGVITTYTDVITIGGCQVTKTVAVTPNQTAIFAASADTSVCTNGPVTVSILSGNAVSYTWTHMVNGNPVTSTGNSVTINPVRNDMVIVSASTNQQCAKNDTVFVNNAAVDVSTPGGLDKKICLGMSIELPVMNNILGDNLTYQWSPNLSTIFNPMVNPTTNAAYTVSVTNQFGCTDTKTFNIEVISLAATVDVSQDTICPGEKAILTVNATGGTDYSYTWSPSSSLDEPTSATPEATPTESTTYFVTVTDANGCTTSADSKVSFIDLLCREPYIFVPTVFTPNEDQKNDFFMVRGANIKELLFVVYDRWGEEMYKTTNPFDTGWDGTFKSKELTPDSYGWYIRVTCVNGEEYTKQGNVTLLK
jgi:gliding motility-associated-like protein